MWTDSSRCSLFLFTCVFLAYSGARATPNGDRSSTSGTAAFAVSSANAFAGAFGGTGNFPGIQNGHKEIRSYDSTGFSHDNDADRDAKSYGTPSGRGADHDHSVRGGGHDYNRNADGCSKCKWENDDYWEQDEPEEEQNEDECDDGDDGQYRPDKTHHYDASDSGRGHAPGPHSYQSGVHKQGPTGVYIDNEDNGVKGGRPGGGNFPTSGAPSDGFGRTTPKPGTGSWNTPFASKPVYSNAGVFGTTTTSWPSWNMGTTPGSFGSSSKSAWNTGYDRTTVGSFVTTPRPETNWNVGSGEKPGQRWYPGFDGMSTTGFPSSQKPAPWNAHDNKLGGNFGTTPIPGSNWNSGFSSATTTGLPSSQKPGAPWSGHNDGTFGTTPRPGQNWHTELGSKPELNSWNPPNYGEATPTSQSDCTRPDTRCNQGKQGPIKVGATPVGPAQDNEYPSGVFPGISHTGSNIPSGSYGSPKQDQWPYGQPGTQSVTTGIGSTSHGRTPDFGKKDYPFGFDKPTYNQVPYDNNPYGGGVDQQSYPNIGSNTYGSENTPDYNRPGSRPHNTWSPNVATTFGTKGPYGVNSPGVQGVTKPSYGTTYSWSTPGQIGSASSSWYGSGSPGPQTGFPGFPTTKTPFNYVATSGSTSSDNPYVGTGPKQSGFNLASATATAGASAFATSFGTHNTPGLAGVAPYGTTPAHGRDTSYPGVKGSERFPSHGIPYGTHPNFGSSWSDKQPDTGSAATPPSRYPETVKSTWPTRQPGISDESRGKPGYGSNIAPGRYPSDGGIWSSRKPGSTSGYPGTTDSSWPAKQPGSDNPWSTRKPGDDSNITPGRYPGSVSGTTPAYGNRPIEQSAGSWPNEESKYGSGSECSSATCGGSNGPIGGSNCGSGNYNCGNSCNVGNSESTVPCSGPSGVNKTYYPAGTGNGNVPSFGDTYGSNSPSNIGTGTYPGAGCRDGDISCNQGTYIIPDGPIKWNPANPFLFGPGGAPPNDVSRPWDSGITVKPLGKGNPFLDSSWSTSPKPGYGANDQNVILLGQDNTKPIGQGNPFLNDKRGDIDINVNEGVIPLGGRKPEEVNSFIRPGSGSNSPSYNQHPSGFPSGSGTLGNDNYGVGNDGSHSGGISPQSGSNTGPYPTGGNPQGPLQCKLGIFGCGTPGSGSYAPTKGKHPGGSFGRIGGNSGSVFDGFGTGIGPGPASTYGAGHPAPAGAYAGSFSSAQASSFANAKSPSDTTGSGNNFGQAYDGSWSGAQNPGGSNSWASGGASASAFASSSSGSWSGSHPTNVKG